MRLAVLWFSTALAQISYLDRQTFQGINSALCFRLLSAEGAVGCSSYSQISGDESMELIQVENQQELDEFAASNRKGTLLIPYSLFTAANVDKLQGKLGGLILQHGTPAKYDDQDSIPNKQFGLYAGDSNAHKWNPTGSQGLYTSFEYPIYEIQGFTENSTIALKEAVQFNKQSQDSQIRYGVEFRGRMESSSSTNAQKCLSRGTLLLK